MLYRTLQFRVLSLPVALAFFLPTTFVRAESDAPFDRVLPLNRFAESRVVRTDKNGFYAMPIAIGDDYFDGNDKPERVMRHLQVAYKVGAKYLRCAFSWNGIEPKQGEYHWEFWDDLVGQAERSGIELIPYVAYTPNWAAKQGKEFWKQAPRDPSLYSDFMSKIAARYRGRVKHWELWNEPDNKDYWTGTVQEYAALIKDAAQSVRQADPNAVLVLGGMANGPSEFLRDLLGEAKIDRYVDVVAIHAYPESWGDERAEVPFQEWIPKVREWIDRNHSGVDLWLNEMGYADYRYAPAQASVYGTHVFYAHEHTREYQASTLFKFYTMAAATGGLSLTGWYRVDDFVEGDDRMGTDFVNHHLGLLDSRGAPKPDLDSLSFYHRLLGRGTRVRDEIVAPTSDSQAVVHIFEKEERRYVVTAWLRSSRLDEVQVQSGLEADPRKEVVSIELPCEKPGLLGVYDAQGHPLKVSAKIAGHLLQDVRLDGSHVFVAEVKCGFYN